MYFWTKKSQFALSEYTDVLKHLKDEICQLLNLRLPSKKPMMVLTEAMTSAQDGEVIRCDNKFYCPAGSSCCKGAQGQWTCCPYKLV